MACNNSNIALGQTYFAIQTRKQELTEEEYERLSEVGILYHILSPLGYGFLLFIVIKTKKKKSKKG